MKNRSVPADVILPHVAYRDVGAAIVWLTEKFGFVEHYCYGDPKERMGAQMCLDKAWIMLESAREGALSPRELGYGTQILTVFVDDVEEHFRRAKDAGVAIFEELHERIYGELQYGAEDLDGHQWLFSRHAKDVKPEDWGATVANQE